MPRTLALLATSLVAVGLFVRAADPPAERPPGDDEFQKTKQKAAFEQERLRRNFGDFQRSLLALAQRYEKSSKSEDREKAVVLRQAIEMSTKEGIDNQFNRLVVTLTGSGITLQEINAAIGQNEQLARSLRELINVLLTDNQTAKLKEEQKRLQDLLKELDKVLRQQKLERANTEAGRLDPKDLAKGQQKVTDDTKKLSKQMGNAEPKDAKGKSSKGEAKPEGKNGKPDGEGKDDTKDPKGDAKKGDPKDAKGDPKDGKGDPKDAKGDPKGGDPKDAKGGDPKDAKGDPKGGDPKDAKGDPKGGDPKDAKGDPKDKPEPGEAKGKPEGQKPPDAGDNKAKPEGKGEAKPGDPKDPKGGEPQKGDPKGDAKPSDSKDQKGQPKGDSPQGQPQEGDPQDGGDPGKPKPQPQQPEDEAPPGRKQVKDAIENQKQAEKNLEKKDKEKASGDQDDAIKNLEEVRKEIEKRLKQLREEELERLLANLENRCQRMLTMQIEVYEATKRIHATVQATEDKKPARAEALKSGEQSDREALIVTEANKTLQLLEEDGSAVAVPQVLENARDDMVKVKDRLFKTDVGPFTQGIEEDIINSLKEVIEALKKAQQDMKDKKDQPPPPPPGGGQPPPQKLIDMLAELKMLKSLQLTVNKRTTSYGKQYPGEQADDADIVKELRNLAGRQVKIQKATKDIATGKAGNAQ